MCPRSSFRWVNAETGLRTYRSVLVVLSSVFHYYFEQQENALEAAEKLSITLPAEMVRVIRDKVSAGIYGSNSEVIRDALRGWMERERRLVALDTSIARGVADAESGRVQDADAVRAELRERFGNKADNSPA